MKRIAWLALLAVAGGCTVPEAESQAKTPVTLHGAAWLPGEVGGYVRDFEINGTRCIAVGSSAIDCDWSGE